MIDLYYLHDLNLISARLYDVELDVERLGADLDRFAADGEGGRDALLAIENALAKIVIHDWPLPDDPVVRQLREAALVLSRALAGTGNCG
jgi:hypothetical protein